MPSLHIQADQMANKLGIIGVPIDLGGNRRGVDMGPYALRHAGLIDRLRDIGYEVKDFGNIETPVRDMVSPGSPQARYLAEIIDVSKRLCKKTEEILGLGYIPLTIGGDHSCAIGSIAGVSAYRKDNPFGILWVDAHGDLNLPGTTPSGNIHGMPASIALGRGPEDLVNLGRPGPKVAASDLVHIGIRQLDPHEVSLLASGSLSYYAMSEIDAYGIHSVTEAALERVTRDFTIPVHLSFDIDSLDPSEAPGVGTPVEGGLSIREAFLMMEMIATARLRDGSRLLCSMDIVEVNPILDNANQTAVTAVNLTASVWEERRLKLRPLRS